MGILPESGGWGEGLEGRASADAGEERERIGQTGASEPGRTEASWGAFAESAGEGVPTVGHISPQ